MAVSKKKLLAPNGKMYTIPQLDKLNMKQVFDMLVKLGVADRAMYADFKKSNKSAGRSRRRSRRTSKPAPVYYWQPNKPMPPAPPLPARRRSRPTATRKGCPNKGKYSCQSSPNCTWTGYACLNKTSRAPSRGASSCVGRRSSSCNSDPACYWTGSSCLTR